MSRDVFYLVPSENDGRNEQQATTSERVNDNNERSIDSNEMTNGSDGGPLDRDDDSDDHLSSSNIGMLQPLLKENVYHAAKDGLPIALLSALSNVDSEVTKNAYINEVSVQSI